MANKISLPEFIQMPDVVDLHIGYSEALLAFLDGKEYVRLGKVVTGNKAVIYVKEDRVQEVLRRDWNKGFGTSCVGHGIAWYTKYW